jgi:RNA polymerase sigma-70 factor (ECF subfamily)
MRTLLEPTRQRTRSLAAPTGARADALVADHGDAVRAFVRARVADAAAADDLVQATFAAALDRGVPESDGPAGVGRWLFAIARNLVLKEVRDGRAHDGATRPHAGGAERAASAPGPLEAVAGAEEQARVRAALATLDVDLREVVLLRYEADLDYRAIAERLEVPVSTIQGRLARARVALADLLVRRSA